MSDQPPVFLECGFAYYTTGDKPVNIKNIHKDMDIFYVVLNCFSV